MRIRFPSFEGSITERQILSRGLNMYEEDYIDQVETTGTNEWTLEVLSERLDYVRYEVSIGIDNNRVTYSDCDCPYRQGPVCKHIVASLYYIRENDLYTEIEIDEESEDEESEDEVPVPRRSRNSNSGSKGKPKRKQDDSNNSMDLLDFGAENYMDTDDVEKEFYCQVCLGIMNKPVSMPCNAHSVCYDCTLLLYKHQRKEVKGHKLISCPTCREGSGVLKIRKSTDIRVNLELKRIKEAYARKKRAWMKEKEFLQEMLGPEKGDKKQNQEINGDQGLVVNRKTMEEEIETVDLSRLGELAVKILTRLHDNGLTGGPVMEKFKEFFEGREEIEKGEEVVEFEGVKKVKEEAKSKEKSGFKREVRPDEEANGGRRYPLRNLKKVKKI